MTETSLSKFYSGDIQWSLIQCKLAPSSKLKRLRSYPIRGVVLAEAEEKETIIYAHIGMIAYFNPRRPAQMLCSDKKAFDEARAGIPVTTQRRFDVYPDVSA